MPTFLMQPCWQRVIAWSVLVVAAMIVLLPNLSYPLIEPDETRYAQIAIEMIDSRDWVTPTLDGTPYLDKPPLMYWLTATSFEWFGISETAARMPSVLAALATIVLTYLLGQRIVGGRAAWLGAISLLLCGGFVLTGRFLILDSLLTLFSTLSLLAGYIALQQRKIDWCWWMVSAVACALGILTKGPVALVLCVPPLVISGWLRRDHTQARPLHWAVFGIPLLLLACPWYVAVCSFNPEFADYFFWEHNFKRFTAGSNHPQPFWFFVPVLLAGMFPTSLLLPSVAVYLTGRSNPIRSLRTKDLGFLVCSAVWILVFFSLSSCKLPTYILPMFPLTCLLVGGMLDQTVFRSGSPTGVARFLLPFPQRTMLILVAVLVIVAAVDVWFRGSMGAGTIAVVACAMGLAGGLLMTWRRQSTPSPISWSVMAMAAGLTLGFAGWSLMPGIARSRSVYGKARQLASEDPSALLVFFGEKPHAAKLQLPVDRVVYFPQPLSAEFVGFVSGQRDLILVTDDETINQTRDAIASSHDLIESGVHRHLYVARFQR
ncbi:glycosyltransferase family 39 protein [Stieleria sp. TO1_6]|uniref:ArnT family glycosyltransferase n=1 Tax=Stieleria tagensis TaxID=2956795 RepID=UPI00209A8735|nr:glycosyltransferase family 39 protein [Stieleria tagensis]MCO8121683.1 glycosyltransferase family 39 protein [Stieleria tagensis]